MFVAGTAAWLTLACTASRSCSQYDAQARRSVAAADRMRELQRADTLAAMSQEWAEAMMYESCVETYDTLAAGQAVLAVPLADVGALPPGAGFGCRDGRLSLAVRCRGDTLVVEARSDSVPRAVMRVERREMHGCRLRDSAVSSVHEVRIRSSSDSVAQLEVRSVAGQVRDAPPARRGWRFAAGVAVGVLLLAGLRRFVP